MYLEIVPAVFQTFLGMHTEVVEILCGAIHSRGRSYCHTNHPQGDQYKGIFRVGSDTMDSYGTPAYMTTNHCVSIHNPSWGVYKAF